MKIKGLIFDLDGVLVDTKKIHFDALNVALKSVKFDQVSFKDHIVKVRLLGNCMSCSVNQMTLKNGVEMTIKKHVPGVKEVISI